MKTSSTKTIPKFKSEREEAKFWKNHSITEFEDDLVETKNIRFPKPRKRLISLRVDDDMIASLKKTAAQKGLGYLTLIRMWIAERLSKENSSLHSPYTPQEWAKIHKLSHAKGKTFASLEKAKNSIRSL